MFSTGSINQYNINEENNNYNKNLMGNNNLEAKEYIFQHKKKFFIY